MSSEAGFPQQALVTELPGEGEVGGLLPFKTGWALLCWVGLWVMGGGVSGAPGGMDLLEAASQCPHLGPGG